MDKNRSKTNSDQNSSHELNVDCIFLFSTVTKPICWIHLSCDNRLCGDMNANPEPDSNQNPM